MRLSSSFWPSHRGLQVFYVSNLHSVVPTDIPFGSTYDLFSPWITRYSRNRDAEARRHTLKDRPQSVPRKRLRREDTMANVRSGLLINALGDSFGDVNQDQGHAVKYTRINWICKAALDL